MQIKVNANHSAHTGESFGRWASTELNELLSRFSHDITRVEVHMSDESGDKPSDDKKRCTMEARLAHHEPMAVNHAASNEDEAFRGAGEKLKHMLEHALGRLRSQRRERESIRRPADSSEA